MLDEIGPKGLVASVKRVGGFEEEARAEKVIHDPAPAMSVDFRWLAGRS
jgi:hypothetical protein